MNFVIDMNLSPKWVVVFEREGFAAKHWSEIGDIRATDQEIVAWAQSNQYVVFTHDLDFGTLLALTQSHRPSVIQVRAEDIMPDSLGPIVVQVINEHRASLESGALITIDERRSRVRILPI